MKAVVALLVVFAALCTAQVCPLTGVAPAVSTAWTASNQACASWNNTVSCCNPTLINTNLGQTLGLLALLGGGNCTANLNNLLCSVFCNPNGSAWITVNTTTTPPTSTVALSSNSANGIADSCANVCAPPANTMSLSTQFNYTTSQPNRGAIFFTGVAAVAGSNPAITSSTSANAFVLPVAAAGPNDQGCAPASTTGAATSGAVTTGAATANATTSTSTSDANTFVAVSAFTVLAAVAALL